LAARPAPPQHETVTAFAAAVGKTAQETDHALEDIPAVGTADSAALTAVWTVDALLPAAGRRVVGLFSHGKIGLIATW
jgi:hypothetical protein